MPHSTMTPRGSFESRTPSSKLQSLERFPDHDESISTQGLEQFYRQSPVRQNGHASIPPPEGLQRIDSGIPMNGPFKARKQTGRSKHSRQPSLSDALKNISTRRGSVSSGVHEIAESLKAPVSPKLIILCIMWYFSSALTQTSSKSILNAFPKPATLTLIQFGLVTGFCILSAWLATIFPALRNAIPSLRNGIRYPNRDIITTTLPLAVMLISGHLLSSTATAKIPVSLVHTIKGLSPLFTVLAYRFYFDIRYDSSVYFSLIPLTLGVMIACSSAFFGNMVGMLYAFLAAMVFVAQNIYQKQLFNQAAQAEADGSANNTVILDKLNLLCYCSGLSFILTSPIWFCSEGLGILSDFLHDGSLDLTQKPESFDHGRLFVEYIFNGTFQFGQSIIAFVILSMVSAVTYSVANLIKRVFIIVAAIIWFRNPTTKIQAFGIALTFFGLYLYDRTHSSSKADRKAKLLTTHNEALLPLNTRVPILNGAGNGYTASPMQMSEPRSNSPYAVNGYAITSSQVNGADKRDDDGVRNGARPRGSSNAAVRGNSRRKFSATA